MSVELRPATAADADAVADVFLRSRTELVTFGFLAASTKNNYLLPAWVGRGVGTRLLERARRELSPPIRLYAFQVLYEWRPE